MAPVDLGAGYVFQPCGRQLVDGFLIPKAGLGGFLIPGLIDEGVDVFSLRPRALPFWRIHRRHDGQVWGFFFAARPAAGNKCPAPGGCWVRYGREKAYYGQDGGGGEPVAFMRRFAYRITWKGGAVSAPTRWRIKEYRLNTDAAAFRAAHPDPEAAGVVFVLHKVFRKAAPSPPRPPLVYCSESEEEEEEVVDQELDELVLDLRTLTEGK
ncbi:uncharacterized protein LOC124671830 [Lolium rigidum]|uniref:uncharacterized protein LOC124671830 n=1 Tax=Lolium rigidum TaxID=89674 RepID=UPI001F5E32C2|nr:uncharacterized protein LOC124671830 [Lolium rigidum]